MPHQVHDALLRAMCGTKLSRVRTELRLLLPEPINQSLLVSRGAGIVMQSTEVLVRQMSGYPGGFNGSTQHSGRTRRALKTKAKSLARAR
jgi:hypothetical protein